MKGTLRLALLLPALLVLTAGCLGPGNVTESAVDDPTPPAAERGPVTWFLTEEMGLTPVHPTATEPQRVPTGNFYERWATGAEQPTWKGAPAGEDLLLVGNATLTYWVEAEHAVPTTGPRDEGFPEYVAYFGTEASPVAYASVAGPDVMVQGDVHRFTVNLTLPPGGLVLEEGVRPQVIIAPVQGQDDRATRLNVLVNGTVAPSRVVVQAEPVDLAEPRWREEASHPGTLAGSAYAADTPTTSDRVPLEVNASTTRVAMELTSEGVGVRDIDLALRSPGGELVAQSATPHPREGVVVHAPTLRAVGPGAWTVEVTNYGHAAASYDLHVDVEGT